LIIWAIIPVKPIRLGKSRLSALLSDNERIKLNTDLLKHTLQTLTLVSEIDQVLVVSRDPNVLSIARDHGAKTILENGEPHLNMALAKATALAQQHSIGGVLILPADLPLLSGEEVQSLVMLAKNPPVVVISPDRREEGTIALLISPPGLINFDYGPGSFGRHCQRTKAASARLEIVRMPSLAFDLDIPEDLKMLQELKNINHKNNFPLKL
jgi:2-phospho-L-lactate guanylyltransferase